MKRMILVVGILFFSGCISPLSMTTWKGQRIYAGQSNDSVEKVLGPPDRSGTPIQQIGQMASPGIYTVEWIYWGEPQSLRLWFDSGELTMIWLTDTKDIK